MRLAILALLALAAPAAARDLPVPASKGWKHARTGLVLPPVIDGLQRTTLSDLTATEHDVAAEFVAPDKSSVVTIYLFHPAIADVAMWFERSQAALYNRAIYGEVAPASPDAIAFAAPGSPTASGLRRVYAPGKGPFRGTGLAVMPLGEWLVAVRISSTVDPAGALDARLSRVIAGLRWPSGTAAALPAAAIAACPTPLAFDGKARPAKPQASDLLMALIGARAAQDRAAAGVVSDPVRWCRDPASAASYGVYRNTAHDAGYTLALQDAGRVVYVTPSLDTQMGKGSTYSVSLADVDGSRTSFPGFDRLPTPDQVVRALGGPKLGVSNGKQVTIDAKAL